jgi:hypothetical protein
MRIVAIAGLLSVLPLILLVRQSGRPVVDARDAA